MNTVKNVYKMSYDSGWKLKLASDGMGPRLFMEWLAGFYDRYKRLPIYKITIENEDLASWFKISFETLTRDEADGLRIYIRENI